MRKILSVLLSIFLLFGLFLSIFTVSLERTFFRASFHAQNLEEIEFYQQVRKKLIPQLIFQSEGFSAQRLGPLTEKDFQELLAGVLSRSWLKQEIEGNLENLFTYLKGKRRELLLSVDLAPLKRSFQENFLKTFQKKINRLPECSVEQLQRMKGGDKELKCRPPQMRKGELPPQVKEMSSKMTEKLPEEINLKEKLPGEAEEKLVEVREKYKLFQKLKLLIFSVTGFFLLLVLLVNRKNIFGYLKSFSWVIFVFSLLLFAFAKGVSLQAAQILPPMPPAEIAALDKLRDDLITASLRGYLNFWVKISVGLFVISLLFLLFFSAFNKQKKNV